MARDFSKIPKEMWSYTIINREELLMMIPYSMAHIYRLEAAGNFPPRIQLGKNRVGWRLSDVMDWLASRPEGRLPSPQLA